MEDKRKILSGRYDFSLIELFRIVDRPGTSFLSRQKLLDFVRRNGLSMFEDDIDAILRRFDGDGDAQLSYSEFVEGILPTEPSYRPSEIPTYVPRSPSRSPRHASPLRRSGSPGRDSPSHFTSSYLSVPESSYAAAARLSPSRGGRVHSPLTAYEETEVATAFRQ